MTGAIPTLTAIRDRGAIPHPHLRVVPSRSRLLPRRLILTQPGTLPLAPMWLYWSDQHLRLGTNTQSATHSPGSCIWKGLCQSATTPFIIYSESILAGQYYQAGCGPHSVSDQLYLEQYGFNLDIVDSVPMSSSGARNPTVNLPLGIDLLSSG